MSRTQDKTIYFVRHGQSIDNVEPVFQGVDSPLSPEGEKQAGQIANRLSHLEFEALVASPVKRAKQTAEAIAKATGKNIHFSDLFVERIKPSSVGEGKPWKDKEAQRIWREWDETYLSANSNVKFEDGENYVEIIKRADDALKYLLDRPEQTIVVVTHGYFLRTLLSRAVFEEHLTPVIMRQFQDHARSENTGITVLKYIDAFEQAPAWRLWIYNDHAHFAE